VFSCFIPLILPFGCLFFVGKYITDKYNLVYVCPKDFDSDGKILNTALTYVIVVIVFSQLVMSGFFLVKQLFFQSLIIFLVMIFNIAFYSWLTYRRNKYLHKQTKMINQMYKNRNNEEEEDVLEKTDELNALKGAYVPECLK